MGKTGFTGFYLGYAEFVGINHSQDDFGSAADRKTCKKVSSGRNIFPVQYYAESKAAERFAGARSGK